VFTRCPRASPVTIPHPVKVQAIDRWAAISGLNTPETIARAVLRVAGSKAA